MRYAKVPSGAADPWQRWCLKLRWRTSLTARMLIEEAASRCAPLPESA